MFTKIFPPLLTSYVPAGFPSPAEDSAEECLDLNKYLVANKEATFFMRVKGDSMNGVGILDEDLLVVDRSLPVKNGSIVVAVINSEFTVKQIIFQGTQVILRPANPHYRAIFLQSEEELKVWGVVRWAIHKL